MNITSEQPYTIFRNDYNGYSYYKLGISRKKQDGSYMNGYVKCQFKKGVSIENKTRIYLKKSWLSFNLKDKDTIPFIFISEFETIDETIEKAKVNVESSQQNIEQPDPFADFGEEIQLTDDDLPF